MKRFVEGADRGQRCCRNASVSGSRRAIPFVWWIPLSTRSIWPISASKASSLQRRRPLLPGKTGVLGRHPRSQNLHREAAVPRQEARRAFIAANIPIGYFGDPEYVGYMVAFLVSPLRLVEHGRDVGILLDSITRLGRAYNTGMSSSGKVLTGGVDAHAF